jgi:hypothetical protein
VIVQMEDHVPQTIYAFGIIHNHQLVAMNLHQELAWTFNSQSLIPTILCSLDWLEEELDAVDLAIISDAKLVTVVVLLARMVLLNHQLRLSLLSERQILISMTLRW